ncbi:hypothetical protein PHYBLDRAFT_149770 [Phycomyces blakesleeanus NRRL 1555(-)]|uniref:Uncharacterized protein n=1 Tax=Phycomyces blakesleeanus (strain ATCC 8743b / DSM 1359 / FGSC 10004 / NBRC 33097 / NRRL 1555) TaxID=763407 RepID=A0A167L1F7_PHYB8|nr:hypothetical protein PHYBLDRAFT_149770 [Phycomyces blakesleeanus NRRL 1555(-)]OAD69376.1 hypothetical protein PHYBLDRAFT_149770 [Phycomyces blakesleeanus NRRL 1555(-)]|eukprot:XP_018287416.1 hypothetical protein PHYBLDRAFT_149770 [Phycomyces blakesleeanus NRRL 1555(-)]
MSACDAFVKSFYKQCCNHSENAQEDKSKHIATHHLVEVFENRIKPKFLQETHHLLNPRAKGRYADPEKDSEVSINQAWKNDEDGYNSVDIIEWAVDSGTESSVKEIFSKVIPVILLIADDYDVLFKCLKYLSDDRDLGLLEVTYPCLIDLIVKTKKPESKERIILLEKVLTHGVLLGNRHAGHKPAFLLVLLQPVSTLYKKIGLVGTRYLKEVLSIICHGLSVLPHANGDNNHCVPKLIIWCSIPKYNGMILRALAEAWLVYKDLQGEETKAICNLLQKDYQILDAICHDLLKMPFYNLTTAYINWYLPVIYKQ